MADNRKRKRKPYTLDQARLIGTHALMECEAILLDDNSQPGDKIRAANSISSLLNSYAKISEISDLEERITILEQQKNGTQQFK